MGLTGKNLGACAVLLAFAAPAVLAGDGDWSDLTQAKSFAPRCGAFDDTAPGSPRDADVPAFARSQDGVSGVLENATSVDDLIVAALLGPGAVGPNGGSADASLEELRKRFFALSSCGSEGRVRELDPEGVCSGRCDDGGSQGERGRGPEGDGIPEPGPAGLAVLGVCALVLAARTARR